MAAVHAEYQGLKKTTCENLIFLFGKMLQTAAKCTARDLEVRANQRASGFQFQPVLFHEEVSLGVCCHCTETKLLSTVLKMQNILRYAQCTEGCKRDFCLPTRSSLLWCQDRLIYVAVAFIIYVWLPSSPGVSSMPLSRHVISRGHAKCFSKRNCRRTHSCNCRLSSEHQVIYDKSKLWLCTESQSARQRSRLL